MVNDTNKIFKNNDFGDANGGTEQQVQFLLDNVDNELLSQFDWIVSYPIHGFVKEEDSTTILYIHDLPDDPAFDTLRYKDVQDQYDHFIFVSYIQKEAFRLKFNLPFEKCYVLRNCITPIESNLDKFDNLDKIKIIYTSAPHKGLPIVYEVFKVLANEVGDLVELNVCSNFGVYGSKHLERNKPYEDIFKGLEENEKINNYGYLEHSELIEKLKECHIWVNPSMFPETSCKSLMEAASANCVLVHNDLGSLPETSASFSVMYSHDTNPNRHASVFYENILNAIQTIITNPKASTQHLTFQKFYFDNFYGVERRKKEWSIFLNSIKKEEK